MANGTHTTGNGSTTKPKVDQGLVRLQHARKNAFGRKLLKLAESALLNLSNKKVRKHKGGTPK